MSEKRLQRLNSLIKREISQIILREFDFPQDVLTTVTRAESSANLQDCSIFISVLPESKKESAVDFLNRKIFFLQQKLNQRLRMRPIPKIKFLAEKMTVEAGQVEEVLERLKNTAG